MREFGLEGAIPSKIPCAKADGDTDKFLPTEIGKRKSSGGQTNIDNGAARKLRQNRQTAFGKYIWEGILFFELRPAAIRRPGDLALRAAGVFRNIC